MSKAGEKRKLQDVDDKQELTNGNTAAEEDFTTVCNVKVSYLRPKFSNLKEWVDDKNNYYIGRAGVVFVDGKRFPRKQSVWANPFKVGKDGNIFSVLQKFEAHIREKIDLHPSEYNIEELRHHNLGCWCVPSVVCAGSSAPIVCHGQILMKLLSKKKKI